MTSCLFLLWMAHNIVLCFWVFSSEDSSLDLKAFQQSGLAMLNFGNFYYIGRAYVHVKTMCKERSARNVRMASSIYKIQTNKDVLTANVAEPVQ